MRADRLLSLMLMLAARGRLTAGELAGRLEVSERTIYRDVEALSSAGIPVYTQSGVNGGVFLDEHYRVSLTGFSRTDLQALFVADDARPLADLGLAREATMLKLFAALPLIQRREVERARQRLYIDPTNWFQIVEASPVLPILQQAVWEDRRVEVCYQAVEGHASARTLDAYGLVAKANIWYLVARKAVGDSAGEMRNYRVARLSEVTLCDYLLRARSGVRSACLLEGLVRPVRAHQHGDEPALRGDAADRSGAVLVLSGLSTGALRGVGNR